MHRVNRNSACPQLHSIFIEVTSACNCSCLHCRESFNSQTVKMLDLKQISNLLWEAKELGASYAIITGGEPLLHPHLIDIIAATHEMGFETLLATNGILFNNHFASALSAFPKLSIQISLESSEPECHDFLRGGKGLFKKAVVAASLCNSFRIPFSTSMTLTKKNYEDVDSFVRFSKEIGANNVKLRRFIASGAGYRNYSLLELSSSEIKNIARQVVNSDRFLQQGVEVAIEQAPFGILFFEERNALAATKGTCIGCSAGIALCVIGPDGQFRPCPSVPLSVADTNDDSLMDIWRSNSVLLTLRERTNLTGNCGRCAYRQVCGGCRADAYCLSGDLFSEDPCCWHEPDTVLI